MAVAAVGRSAMTVTATGEGRPWVRRMSIRRWMPVVSRVGDGQADHNGLEDQRGQRVIVLVTVAKRQCRAQMTRSRSGRPVRPVPRARPAEPEPACEAVEVATDAMKRTLQDRPGLEGPGLRVRLVPVSRESTIVAC